MAKVPWGRSLLWAVVTFVAVLLLGAVAAPVLGLDPSAARQLGRSVGRLALFSAVVVFAATALANAGRRKAALAVAIVSLLFVVLAVAAASVATPNGP